MIRIPDGFAWEHISNMCGIVASINKNRDRYAVPTFDDANERATKFHDVMEAYAKEHDIAMSDIYQIFTLSSKDLTHLERHDAMYFLRMSGDVMEIRGFILCTYSPQCAVCKKATTKRCAVCKTTYYCSRQCQAADWNAHRATHD